ncbi:MAG: outer membrane lipoprotein carrier protein LolA [Alphaproteobacteria bacterium]
MTKPRSSRLGATIAAGAVLLLAAVSRADQTGGGSLRGHGPGCADHEACFEGFAAKQRKVKSIVSGFRETRSVPGQAPVVLSGQFSWRAPGNPNWQLDSGSQGKAGAAASVLGEIGRLFTSTDEFATGRFDRVAGPGGPQTIRLVPRNKGASETIEGIDLEVDPSTGLVRSATVFDKGGTRTRIELVEAALDQPDPVR